MEGTGEFGVKMNAMPKYVVSSTLEKAEWTGSILIKKNAMDEIRKLKTQPGKDLLLAGSGQLFNACMKENLIDVYRFMLHPVVLGKGMRLFTERDRRALDLTDIKRFAKGIVILEYAPANQQ